MSRQARAAGLGCRWPHPWGGRAPAGREAGPGRRWSHPWGGRAPAGREAGSATVLSLGLIGVLVVCLAGVCALLSAVQASHRARAAADMAALAGAGALLDPAVTGAPCRVASAYVTRNGGRVLECDVAGETVTIEVAVTAGWPGLGSATARARAGPSAYSEAGSG